MFSSVFPLIRNCSIDLLRLLLFHPWGACATDLVGPGHRLERCRCFATGPVPQCKHVWTQGIKLQHVATPSWLTWSARCLLQSFFSHSSVILQSFVVFMESILIYILPWFCLLPAVLTSEALGCPALLLEFVWLQLQLSEPWQVLARWPSSNLRNVEHTRMVAH